MKKYSTISEFAQSNKTFGTWPHSVGVLWALRKRSKTNGFDRAFITVGRRVLIDVEMFWKILEEKRG